MYNKKYFIACCVGLGIVFLTIAFYQWRRYSLAVKNAPTSSSTSTNSLESSEISSSTTSVFQSLLDGEAVADITSTMPQVIAIMLDNHPDARPQASLAKAKVVYEAPVEGEYTRYMALFDVSQEIPKVGPVRSARPYFLDWVREYGDPMYVHSGGSPQALEMLRKSDIFDVNEFYFGKYFYRGNIHFAPHNLYTTSEDLQSVVSLKAALRPVKTWLGWNYLPNSLGTLTTSSSTVAGETISLPYARNYKVGWRYNEVLGLYQRLLNSEVNSTDEQKEIITARNVVVQQIVIRVLDDEGRKQIATIGTGKAWVFQNGEKKTGTWQKKSLTDRTRFYDEAGVEIALLPGKTWIEVIPQTMDFE